MNLNYDILRTFSVVAGAPSFAAAAKRLFVTVSAVSQQMKTLEAQVGYPLFERVGRRSRLTEAGQRLATSLRDPFAAIDEAVGQASQDRGVVTLGAPRAIASRIVIPRLKVPDGVELRFVFDVPSALERLLVEGELDACLLARAPQTNVQSRVFMEEAFVPVASPAYLKRKEAPAYAVFDRDYAMHAAWFGKKLPKRVVCEAPSLEALLEIAAAGIAIAVLPTYFIDKRVVPVSERVVKNKIYVCWRHNTAMTAKRRWLLESL